MEKLFIPLVPGQSETMSEQDGPFGLSAGRSGSMEQRSLFEPERVARAELCDAIARLDFTTASRTLEEFQRLWPAAEQAWEPEVIRIGSELAGRLLDLDPRTHAAFTSAKSGDWETDGS